MTFAFPSTAENPGTKAITAELELALLRHFEPVLRFTRGEQFFPIDVERYVQIASLWYQRPGEDAICVLGQGEVTLDMLTRVDMGRPDAVYFLKFTEPLDATELAVYQDQSTVAGYALGCGPCWTASSLSWRSMRVPPRPRAGNSSRGSTR